MQADTVTTATARADDAGVAGNARLTAANGLLLLVLLFIEGVTILRVRDLITLHVFVGLMLVGPVLLKTATTGYRFTRYYAHAEPYVRRGPPHAILRLSGPLVVLTTLTVLGTGIGLLAVKPDNPGVLLFAHKASFVLWFGLMAIHVLGHLREAASESWQDVRARRGDPAGRHRGLRMIAIVTALLAGIGLAAAVTPSASAWTNRHDRGVERH